MRLQGLTQALLRLHKLSFNAANSSEAMSEYFKSSSAVLLKLEIGPEGIHEQSGLPQKDSFEQKSSSGSEQKAKQDGGGSIPPQPCGRSFDRHSLDERALFHAKKRLRRVAKFRC